MKVDPNTDLLPGEQDVLDGKASPNTPDVTEADALALDAGADTDNTPAPKPEDTPAQAPAAAVEDTPLTAAPAPAAFVVDDPAKFTETFEALQAKKAGALKELMDGTMEADAYAVIDTEVTQGLLKLNTNMTLHEQNVQQEQARQKTVLDDIRTSASTVGIDYADPGLAALFDTKMRTLAASPEMAGKSASDIYQATHAEVLKLFGKTPSAAPAPAPTPTASPAAAATPAAPAPKPQIPPTLGALPSAATPTIGNGLLETLGAIENPDDAEAMLMKLPPGQVDAALRASIPNNRRH